MVREGVITILIYCNFFHTLYRRCPLAELDHLRPDLFVDESVKIRGRRERVESALDFFFSGEINRSRLIFPLALSTLL